jgi:hypothetical protein
VRPENAVWMAVPAAHELVELGTGDGPGSSHDFSILLMASSGMSTQPGRLRAS